MTRQSILERMNSIGLTEVQRQMLAGTIERLAEQAFNSGAAAVRENGLGLTETGLQAHFDRFWLGKVAANRKYRATTNQTRKGQTNI